MLASLFSLLPLATLAVAGVQELWWNVTYVQNANPDGQYPRQVIGINGTWPYVNVIPPSWPYLTHHLLQTSANFRQHDRLSRRSLDQLD